MSKEKKEEMKDFLDFLKNLCEKGLSEKDEKILEDTKKNNGFSRKNSRAF